MADSSRNSTEGIFRFFFASKRIINEKLSDVEKLTSLAINSTNKIDKNKYLTQAHDKLLKSGYVVPIGQPQGELYYSKRITEVQISDWMLGFPRIDKVQL